jgi:hypothetical protein
MVDELAVCVVVVWVIPEVPRRFFLHSVRDVSKNRTSPELFERDDAVGTTGGATLATGVEVFGNICAQEAFNVILT